VTWHAGAQARSPASPRTAARKPDRLPHLTPAPSCLSSAGPAGIRSTSTTSPAAWPRTGSAPAGTGTSRRSAGGRWSSGGPRRSRQSTAAAARFRISAGFTEWCQGLPVGWVVGIAGLPYGAQIRALGNGVVPAQAVAALRLLIQIAAVPGAPSPADLTWPHEKSVDADGPGRKASPACTPAPPGARGRPAPSAAARAPRSQGDGQLAATLAQCSSSGEAARAPSRDAPGSRPAPAGSRARRDCR
jgi:hypothetical protein